MTTLIYFLYALILLKGIKNKSVVTFISFNVIFGLIISNFVTGPFYFFTSSLCFLLIAHAVKDMDKSDKVIECCVLANLLNVSGVVMWYLYMQPTTYQILFIILYLYMFITMEREHVGNDNRTESANKSVFTIALCSFKDSFK